MCWYQSIHSKTVRGPPSDRSDETATDLMLVGIYTDEVLAKYRGKNRLEVHIHYSLSVMLKC